MKRILASLLLCSLTILTARAEKAWDDGYRPYQDVAPEYLEIKVTKVQLQNGGAFFGTNSRVLIQATVTQVFRSSSQLQQGNNIDIAFIRKSTAGTLTLEPSIPSEGQTVPAFLRKKGTIFEPAALHHSFEPLTSQQLQALNKNASARPPVTAAPVLEPKAEPKVEPKKVVKKEKVETAEPAEPLPPPQMIVTAPQPETTAEFDAKTQASVEPTPSPTPKKTKEKKPKVTQPIVITDPEKPVRKDAPPEVPVIVDALPARKGDLQPPPNIDITAPRKPTPLPEPPAAPKVETIAPAVVAAPTPTPTVKSAPITVSTPTLTTEPLDIKKIEPVAVQEPTPKPVRPVTPPVLNVANGPAASAPPAPASAPFDQEGLNAYSSIYAKIKEGDKAADSRETETALKIYKETLMDLEKLKVNKPDFQPFIVEYRQKDLTRKINALEAGSAEPKK